MVRLVARGMTEGGGGDASWRGRRGGRRSWRRSSRTQWRLSSALATTAKRWWVAQRVPVVWPSAMDEQRRGREREVAAATGSPGEAPTAVAFIARGLGLPGGADDPRRPCIGRDTRRESRSRAGEARVRGAGVRVAQRASSGGAGSCPRLGLARGAFFCGDVGAAARELGLGLLGCARAHADYGRARA